MSQDHTAESETWQVAIAPNNVQTMTLEQLDAAYQAGTITEQTLVWTDGMDQWAPLADVAGGDEEEAPAAAPAEATQPAQQAPVAQALGSQAVAFQAVASQAPAPVAASFPPVASVAPFAGAAPVGISAPPGVSQAPAAVSMAPAALSSAPVSTAPVAMNLDGLDLDDPSFGKSGKSKLPWVAAAALVLLGGGITVANMGGGGEEAKAPVAAAAAAAPVAEEGAYVPPQKADPNAPLDLGKAGYEVTAAEQKAFANEEAKEKEMREKMAEALAGQKDAEETKESAKAKVSKANWRPPKAKSGGGSAMKAGGSAYDPLNASLP